MKRRTFIWISAVAAVTVILPISNCSSKSDFDEIVANPITLFQLISSKEIRKLGNLYMQLVPSEATEHIIKGHIVKDTNGKSTAVSLQKSINKGIEHDFKIDKTIIIDGWVLSITEARQCALYSLINS
jgi:hypothetical protein